MPIWAFVLLISWLFFGYWTVAALARERTTLHTEGYDLDNWCIYDKFVWGIPTLLLGFINIFIVAGAFDPQWYTKPLWSWPWYRSKAA